MAQTQGKSQESSATHAGQHTGSLQRQPQTGGVARSSYPYSLSTADFFGSNPFTLMRRMSEEMDRIFGGQSSSSSQSGAGSSWMPAIEVRHSGNELVVCAELPGLKKDDVKVEIEDHALAIHGERKFESNETQGGVHRSERRYGQFYRTIPLPEGAHAEQARATFEDGLLEVKIPVEKEQDRRREIPIQASGSGEAGQAKTPETAQEKTSGTSAGPSGTAQAAGR